MITSVERGRYDWPWRGGTSFVTPDGSQVVLSSPALDASRPWSCGFIALVRGARRAFTVAEAGAFDWHSTYTTIPDQMLGQPYRGGELVTGIRTAPGDYRTAWRGQWFELHIRASGSPDGIMRIFDALRFTDTPLGMLVAPRSASQAQFEPIRVAKQIPRIGHLTIERPGTSQLTVPDLRGHLTRHGELWRQPLGIGAHGRSRSEALVLATPTAITQLISGPADTADPDEALDFLIGLDVIWEPT